MALFDGRAVLPYVWMAQGKLGLGRAEFAQRFYTSTRTMSRWSSKRSEPGEDLYKSVIKAVHPLDPGLAERMATAAGWTLASLRLPAPAGPPRACPPSHLLVDAIVCAAADAMKERPAIVREGLRAAFARARALGMTLEAVDAALASTAAPSGSGSADAARD